MSNVIHGQSHKVLKHLREEPAALAVLWIYASRTNRDNVAWPSSRGLAHDTGWGREACLKARAYLVEHEALEEVKDYVRPDWRKLEPADKARRLNLDKAEYYRPTGKFVINGKTYPVFYYGGDSPSPVEDETLTPADPDGLPHPTSGADRHRSAPDVGPGPMSVRADGRQGGPERSTTLQLDSIVPEDSTTTTTLPSVEQTVEEPAQPAVDLKERVVVVSVSEEEAGDVLSVLRTWPVLTKEGELPSLLVESARKAVDEFGAVHVLHALAIADKAQKKFWAYVDGIFTNWRVSGKPALGERGHEPTAYTVPEPIPLAERSQVAQETPRVSERVHAPVVNGKTPLEIWDAAFNQLEAQLDRSNFDTWLRDAYLCDFEAPTGTFTLVVRNEFARAQCEGRLIKPIRRVTRDVGGMDFLFQFKVPSEVQGLTNHV